MIAIGLMSGTSLDGVDAALVEIRPAKPGYAVRLLHFETMPFSPQLDRALRAALPPNVVPASAIAALHRDLGEAFGAAARAVAGDRAIDFVASHGQTIFHDGDAGTTLQLGDAFRIREAVGVTVCYDFRSADTAAGGQGAPLVPHVDALLFASEREARVALNLGGIANATLLFPGEPVRAFDTGPGNMLVDALVQARSQGRLRFDRDGALARSGVPDETLLQAMLADPFFARTPPKTTGRERFGSSFLALHPRIDALSDEDAAATLTELTAASIGRALSGAGGARARIIVSGGGAHNSAMLARLRARLPEARVETSDAMGVPADAKEAMAFAVLGYETLRERAANVPAATGARLPVVLGAIAPHDLERLLARVRDERAP